MPYQPAYPIERSQIASVPVEMSASVTNFFRGVISKVMAARARVRFPDVGGMHVTYDVDHVKIHHIAA